MKLHYFTPGSAAPRPAMCVASREMLLAPRSDRPTWGAVLAIVGLASAAAFGIVVCLGLLLA